LDLRPNVEPLRSSIAGIRLTLAKKATTTGRTTDRDRHRLQRGRRKMTTWTYGREKMTKFFVGISTDKNHGPNLHSHTVRCRDAAHAAEVLNYATEVHEVPADQVRGYYDYVDGSGVYWTSDAERLDAVTVDDSGCEADGVYAAGWNS
jgi:hypothetical protein